MFTLSHRRETLGRALYIALAYRRPRVLQALLQSHGPAAFAATLSLRSGRVIADALSTLPARQRAKVFRHLTRAARRSCVQVGGPALGKLAGSGLLARLLSFWPTLRRVRL